MQAVRRTCSEDFQARLPITAAEVLEPPERFLRVLRFKWEPHSRAGPSHALQAAAAAAARRC